MKKGLQYARLILGRLLKSRKDLEHLGGVVLWSPRQSIGTLPAYLFAKSIKVMCSKVQRKWTYSLKRQARQEGRIDSDRVERH
jgi:hypothetical protein